MSVKNCPRCGTALKTAGDKFVCPSCRVSLVRKPKGDTTSDIRLADSSRPSAPELVLDFADQAAAPRPRSSSSPGIGRGLVLGGAALFLLLGTVLTGYAFTLTFSTSPEAPPIPVVQKPEPKPVETPAEDWRVTLRDLRELVTTPPATITQPPDYPKPDPNAAKVNKAIDNGVAFLKQTLNERSGVRYSGPIVSGLAGLTLLECGVPASDPLIQRLAEEIRNRASKLGATYQIATDIWFLDRLGEKRDHEVIRSLALRLIANQGPMAGWGYTSPPISVAEERRLVQLLAEQPLAGNWRESMAASLVPDKGGNAGVNGGRAPTRPSRMDQLPVFQWSPGKKLDWHPAGHEDNSLTQFAILALWAARKHGVPVERTLAFVEVRCRTYQNADGSWGYTLRTTARRDSMTCAGLLGLAVGRGLGKQSDPTKVDARDPAIEKALIYVGQIVGRKALNRGGTGKGRLIAAQAWGDLYFLWSMERMAVVYDLKTIAGKDWYAWGSEIILNSQAADGSWNEAFAGVPDTCFALLFLKRVNIVQDLTAQLRLLGKVKDPGHSKPAVILPGDVAKPDEP
jgi:hypothetical protein